MIHQVDILIFREHRIRFFEPPGYTNALISNTQRSRARADLTFGETYPSVSSTATRSKEHKNEENIDLIPKYCMIILEFLSVSDTMMES
jgi:hypothetical protein